MVQLTCSLVLSPAFELLSADSEPCSDEGSTRELFLYGEIPEVAVKAWEQRLHRAQ